MLSYDDLMRERDELLKRVEQLSEENRQLRLQLADNKQASFATSTTVSQGNPSISLSLEEKITLFQSLFKGRTDVFARRWYSKTTNKSGYQPACINEWVSTLCDKKKTKCSDCPNRQFASLDYETIYKHLEGKDEYGRDVIGLYPVFEDNTCYFLCADFDDKNSEHDYQSDVQTFVAVCRDWGIEPSIERSRSGNGAHIWLFFAEAISCKQARKLGFSILTEATNRNGRISFKSYDRFFPNQDILPEGGFGNLVALPLQGLARKQGNSMFVDDNFTPYSDQWKYLQNIKKLSTTQIESILQNHTIKELGELTTSTEDRPWELPKSVPLTILDFPTQLTIIRANGLYIPLKGLSSKVINHLKRIASFKNPEFYNKQAMRFSTFSTPRIICCAEQNEEYIILPRGCEDAILQLLDKNLINYCIVDKTSEGNNIQVSFTGELYTEQQIAQGKLLPHTNGTLSAKTAFGKTVTAAALIAERKVNTLILVHTKALLEQWKNTLSKFLSIEYEAPDTPIKRGRKKIFHPIGTLDSTGNHLSNIVDIVLIQSCITNDEIKDFVRNYGMVIVDECHHVSAVQFERVLRFANARFVYGLTATPIRKDGHQPIIFMQCGPIRYTTTSQAISFVRELYPRFTAFKNISDRILNHSTQMQEIAKNELRNRMIISDVCKVINKGRSPIILTQYTSHVYELERLLAEHYQNIICLTGTASMKQRRLQMERLNNIPPDQNVVIIATGQYVGEGFDFPRLDTLFLAIPISWKGLVAQYTGRLHRQYKGKHNVIVYDYIDINVPLCEKMYRKRLKGYACNGYQLKSSIVDGNEDKDNLQPKESTIFSGNDFSSIFLQDSRNAKQSILLYIPSVQTEKSVNILDCLREKQRSGCNVQILTQDIIYPDTEQQLDLFSPSHLEELTVTTKDSIYLHCAIIDRQILWYGDINYLGVNNKYNFSMRLIDSSITEQVINLLF